MWVHASQFRNRQNSYMVGDVKTVVTDWEGHQEALWGLECVLYFDLGGGYMDVHTYKNLFRCMPNICALYCSYPSFHVLKRGHQFENYCPALASVFLDIKSWVWLWFMSRLCHLSAVYLEEITEPLRTLVSHLYRRGKNSTCSIALFWEFSWIIHTRCFIQYLPGTFSALVKYDMVTCSFSSDHLVLSPVIYPSPLLTFFPPFFFFSSPSTRKAKNMKFKYIYFKIY